MSSSKEQYPCLCAVARSPPRARNSLPRRVDVEEEDSGGAAAGADDSGADDAITGASSGPSRESLPRLTLASPTSRISMYSLSSGDPDPGAAASFERAEPPPPPPPAPAPLFERLDALTDSSSRRPLDDPADSSAKVVSADISTQCCSVSKSSSFSVSASNLAVPVTMDSCVSNARIVAGDVRTRVGSFFAMAAAADAPFAEKKECCAHCGAFNRESGSTSSSRLTTSLA